MMAVVGSLACGCCPHLVCAVHCISFPLSVVFEQASLSAKHAVVPDVFKSAFAMRCLCFWGC